MRGFTKFTNNNVKLNFYQLTRYNGREKKLKQKENRNNYLRNKTIKQLIESE